MKKFNFWKLSTKNPKTKTKTISVMRTKAMKSSLMKLGKSKGAEIISFNRIKQSTAENLIRKSGRSKKNLLKRGKTTAFVLSRRKFR